MDKKISGLLKLSVVVFWAIAYLIGCVPHTVSKKKEEPAPPTSIKEIVAVDVKEAADTVDVWIKGKVKFLYGFLISEVGASKGEIQSSLRSAGDFILDYHGQKVCVG